MAEVAPAGPPHNKLADTPKGFALGYLLYQQVAGVIGAFALVALLGHFFDIGWRGALATLVGMWDAYIRPAVQFAFDVTIVAFLKAIFNWQIHIPLVIRDYLSVGFLVLLSDLRTTLWRDSHDARLGRDTKGSLPLAAFLYRRHRSTMRPVPETIFLWPLVLRWHFYSMLFFFGRRHDPQIKWQYPGAWKISGLEQAMSLLPFAYCILLFAANYLLLKPGT